MTITKAAPPAAPFEVNAPLAEGQVLAPDEDLQIPVTFVPTAAGAASAAYVISSDDGAGSHTIDGDRHRRSDHRHGATESGERRLEGQRQRDHDVVRDSC